MIFDCFLAFLSPASHRLYFGEVIFARNFQAENVIGIPTPKNEIASWGQLQSPPFNAGKPNAIPKLRKYIDRSVEGWRTIVR